MNLESLDTAAIDRREMLRRFGTGFGMVALAGLFHDQLRAAQSPVSAGSLTAPSAANPLAERRPQFAARAKHVIFLFMSGGPSHVDTFDPKPRLARDNGKPLPFAMPKLVRTKTGNLLASPFKFSKRGKSGIEVTDLLPELGGCIDDICVIRSMFADNINHNGACLQMNTGEQAFSRPSWGSWLLYGLGTENQNLPGYVVISPAQPAQGAPLWGSSFLPAAYQGTLVADLKNPINDLKNAQFSPKVQQRQLAVLKQLDELHLRNRRDENDLNARIASFELAFRMQAQSAGGVRHRRRIATNREALRYRRAGDGFVRQAMPDGPAAGGARRALRERVPHGNIASQKLPTLGPAWRPAHRAPEQLRGGRPPHCRAAKRPESPRAAR